jgi:hypothetical protein
MCEPELVCCVGAAVREFFKHSWRVIKRGKTNYLLGVLAVWIVVAIVALLITIISNAPVIFLRLAELSNGEIDMNLYTPDASPSPSLNYTLLSSLLDGAKADSSEAFLAQSSASVRQAPFAFHSPRWSIDADVMLASDCRFPYRRGVDGTRSLPNATDTASWAYVGCDDLSASRDHGNCYPAVCRRCARRVEEQY